MKKKTKILLISVIILIILVICLVFAMNFIKTKDYKNRTIMETNIDYSMDSAEITENNEFNVDNLNIKLTGYNYYPEGYDEVYDEDNLLCTTIDFSTNDSTDLNLITFDYIIYDENNNILNSSLWSNFQNNKNYIECFVKEKYNSNNKTEFTKHNLYGTMTSTRNITDDLSDVSINLMSILKNDYNYPNKVTITLLNVKYSTYDSNTKTTQDSEINNTDFNFILNQK